jgi:thiol-disulfide isomerase/thioredoxin
MIRKPKLSTLLLLILSITSLQSEAQESFIKSFGPGSYQQILRENADQPFVLMLWSVDCPSCLKDMALVRDIQKKRPELKIVMLSTDDPNATGEVKTIISRYQLDSLENWVFGSDDAQKLRYEIDPSWYGELPRTYFFNASHQRIGKSGTMTMEEFDAQFSKLQM